MIENSFICNIFTGNFFTENFFPGNWRTGNLFTDTSSHEAHILEYSFRLITTPLLRTSANPWDTILHSRYNTPNDLLPPRASRTLPRGRCVMSLGRMCRGFLICVLYFVFDGWMKERERDEGRGKEVEAIKIDRQR